MEMPRQLRRARTVPDSGADLRVPAARGRSRVEILPHAQRVAKDVMRTYVAGSAPAVAGVQARKR